MFDIKAVRNSMGIKSQSEFAREAGVGRCIIQRMEKAYRDESDFGVFNYQNVKPICDFIAPNAYYSSMFVNEFYVEVDTTESIIDVIENCYSPDFNGASDWE